MTKEDLKQLMDDKRLTPEEVARVCFVSADAVRKWLRGDRQMSRQSVALLTEYLGGRR